MLLATTIVPIRAQVAEGVNVTVTLQLPFGAIEPMQLLVCEKSPLVVMLLMIRLPLPVLVSLTACVGLFAPTVCEPKLKLGTDQVAIGAVPVPLKVTTWGLPGALSVICIVAVLAPTASGVNAGPTTQLPPAGKLLPHGLDRVESGEKSSRSAPTTIILVKVRVAEPLLVTVTAFTALLVPTVCFPKLTLVVERVTVWPAAEIEITSARRAWQVAAMNE
jgi:hypothetical protein